VAILLLLTAVLYAWLCLLPIAAASVIKKQNNLRHLLAAEMRVKGRVGIRERHPGT
jgi:hypothetical protein